MTEPTKVDTPDARQASMSRVVTQDTLLASLAAPASEVTDVVPKEPTADDKQKDGEEQKPAKKSPQERIVELAHKRREAEAKAEEAEQRAKLLELKLKALEAQAAPIEATARPRRESYASDDDYTDALGDWKADQAIARREQQQAQARQQAEFNELVESWNKRQQTVIDSIPDYAEVLAKSDLQIKDHVHALLLDSEAGPQIAYFLALNPDEAKKLNGMKPLAALKHIASLEKDLADADDEPAKPKATELPKKSKAPEPINPVKSTGSSNPGPAQSFEEYKRRRLGK